MRPNLLVLGDSFSCGEGVGVRIDQTQTWTGLLARAMDAHPDVLAVAGATTAAVRSGQLPIALGREPSWVTLLVGLNDVFRTGFDSDRVRADVQAVVGALRAHHHGVLLARLHDPSEILPLPARLRAALRTKVAVVNDAIDAAAGDGVTLLDLAALDVLHNRGAWAVDRLHPSLLGHALMAAAAAETLRKQGFWPTGTVAAASPLANPTRAAECWWVARHGAPWVARRVRMVGTVVAEALIA